MVDYPENCSTARLKGAADHLFTVAGKHQIHQNAGTEAELSGAESTMHDLLRQRDEHRQRHGITNLSMAEANEKFHKFVSEPSATNL